MDVVERRFRVARWVERLGWRMALIGVMGYLIGFLSARLSGITGSEQTATMLGSTLVWLFFALSVGGLLIVLPFSSLLYRRARRMSHPERAAELDPRSALERSELPHWIGWPLWSVTALGALWLTYMLIRYGIPDYLARGH